MMILGTLAISHLTCKALFALAETVSFEIH